MCDVLGLMMNRCRTLGGYVGEGRGRGMGVWSKPSISANYVFIVVLFFLKIFLLTLAMTSMISMRTEDASMVATQTSACSCRVPDKTAILCSGDLKFGSLALGARVFGDWYTLATTEHSI